jgi:hypothetical protein
MEHNLEAQVMTHIAPPATPAALLAEEHSATEPDGASMIELRQVRVRKRESQEKFWGRFGVTQSSGSRFETGLGIPPPVAILVKLYLNGKLNDGDLLG